ncbi:PEP-CTERM sorting domain-containing protein [Rhodopirellula halodulae]|uniref:PEP-CTERM sorting domain-containing protein n=1 Tax=Rhodopirellula halodulae TaxID=2894198 RepID=UPI0036F3B055
MRAPTPSFNSLGPDPFNTFVPASVSSTINVTAVPEPCSLALLSFVGVAGFVVRRHKQFYSRSDAGIRVV